MPSEILEYLAFNRATVIWARLGSSYMTSVDFRCQRVTGSSRFDVGDRVKATSTQAGLQSIGMLC